MTQTRRCFPDLFKREAVDEMLSSTPLPHAPQTLGIAIACWANGSAMCLVQGERVYGTDLYRRMTRGSGSIHTCHDHACHPSRLQA